MNVETIASAGHNGPPLTPLHARFNSAMEALKRLGLKGEVAVTGGAVLVSCEGACYASPWRKAMRLACRKHPDVELIETRPRKGFYVFSIIIKP